MFRSQLCSSRAWPLALGALLVLAACAKDRFTEEPPPVVVMGDENDDAQCSDKVSNDGDELIDCQDPDCHANPNVTVCANFAAGGVTSATSSSSGGGATSTTTTTGAGGAGGS